MNRHISHRFATFGPIKIHASTVNTIWPSSLLSFLCSQPNYGQTSWSSSKGQNRPTTYLWWAFLNISRTYQLAKVNEELLLSGSGSLTYHNVFLHIQNYAYTPPLVCPNSCIAANRHTQAAGSYLLLETGVHNILGFAAATGQEGLWPLDAAHRTRRLTAPAAARSVQRAAPMKVMGLDHSSAIQSWLKKRWVAEWHVWWGSNQTRLKWPRIK